MKPNNAEHGLPACEHCWHAKRGAIMVVVPDGHTVQQCCKCPATRTVHTDHLYRSAQAIAEGADHV